MKNTIFILAICLGGAAHAAQILSNGGFEPNLTGWITANQPGGDGAFLLQTGTTSPATLISVPAPLEGTHAAMTDAQGPGSHVLYQDFVVPNFVGSAILSFSLYIDSSQFATTFVSPVSLDFATPALNQQVRVDILTPSGNAFDLAGVLLNAYRTNPGDPLTSGYTATSLDVTGLLQANAGQTLRLRFAEVDNVGPLNLGVDSVALDVAQTPEPSTLLLSATALVTLAMMRKRA